MKIKFLNYDFIHWKIHILLVNVKKIPNIIFNIIPTDIPNYTSPGIFYEPKHGNNITLKTTPKIILVTNTNIY